MISLATPDEVRGWIADTGMKLDRDMVGSGGSTHYFLFFASGEKSGYGGISIDFDGHEEDFDEAGNMCAMTTIGEKVEVWAVQNNRKSVIAACQKIAVALWLDCPDVIRFRNERGEQCAIRPGLGCVLALVVFLAGCGTISSGNTDLERRLSADVVSICEPVTNSGREDAVRQILIRDKIVFKEHEISWHSSRISFECNTQQPVLFTAWHDASDAFLGALRVISRGIVDPPLLTEGALDNASGCAVAIELARRGRWVFLAGEHQSGHLGARAFAASLEAWPERVLVLAQLGGSYPEARRVEWFTLESTDAIAWRTWAPISSTLSEMPWGSLPRLSWFDWRETKVALMVGPPPGFWADQLFTIAQTMVFQAGLPITRAHGLADTSGNLEPCYLADAVLLAERLAR